MPAARARLDIENDDHLSPCSARRGIAVPLTLPGFQPRPGEIPVSALTEQGVEALKEAAINLLVPGGETHGGFITSLRHENLFTESAAMPEKARGAANAGLPHELLLLDLCCALRPIDAITGVTTADDILNRIFSRFCIGKWGSHNNLRQINQQLPCSALSRHALLQLEGGGRPSLQRAPADGSLTTEY